jgi:hypothetical protein
LEVAAELGGEDAAEHGIKVFDDEVEWDVIEEIPNDSAAALILIEHHWAVRLSRRDRARGRLPHRRRDDRAARPAHDRPRLDGGSEAVAGARAGRERHVSVTRFVSMEV